MKTLMVKMSAMKKNMTNCQKFCLTLMLTVSMVEIANVEPEIPRREK